MSRIEATLWVKEDTEIHVGHVSMAMYIGECRLFFDDSEVGLQKIQEIIDTLEKVRAAGPLCVAGEKAEQSK